jgi:hypothetical protein
MCRALKLLCAAAGRERLMELKRAAAGATWELVGGAASEQELTGHLAEWRPDIVVLDAALGAAAVAAIRAGRATARIVSVGRLEGVDAVADSLEGVRQAVLGVPKPRGPVRS